MEDGNSTTLWPLHFYRLDQFGLKTAFSNKAVIYLNLLTGDSKTLAHIAVAIKYCCQPDIGPAVLFPSL